MNPSSAEQVQALREDLERNGYVCIPKTVFCLDQDTVNALRDAFEDLFNGTYETGIYPDEIHWRRGISRPDATREICNGWKANKTIASVVCSQQLGKLACALMGWTSSRLGQDDVLHKPPNSSNSPIGFHQDGAYISDNFIPLENNCLTMWMALDDADEETGALQYAPGSHLWKTDASAAIASDEDQSNTPLPSDVEETTDVSSLSFHVGEGENYMASLRQAAQKAGVDPSQAVASVKTIPVRTGELVVHHQNVWHGSGPNISPHRPRRALVAHLLNGQVQWSVGNGSFPHYIYGRYYIRGESIPRDDFFPFTYGSTTR